MRLKLILKTQPNSVLAYNHQHALRAVIYKVLHTADPVFSQWLHEKGYEVGEKKAFKLFCFDALRGKPFLFDNQRQLLTFPTGIVEWQVSFCVDEQIEKFVEGLFRQQTLEVVADGTKVVFQVQSVEIVPKPEFKETMRFRVQSGICLAEKTETDKYPQYRSPDDAAFEALFWYNLEGKVRSTLSENEEIRTPQYLDLKIVSAVKKWRVTEPSKGSLKPIKTVGYQFDFDISAPIRWLEVGYFAGFGKSTSSGFGFCDVLK